MEPRYCTPLLLSLIPNLCSKYSNLQPPEPCGAQSSPQLWTWLLTYGIVVLCTAAVQIISIVLIEKLFALYIVVTLLVGLFMFAWNIVGAVALFRDSPTCQRWAYDLWAMCLAVLIIQWVGMLFSCCSGYSLKDNNN